MTQFIDSLVEELNMRLGDQPFYTIRQLVDCGLFGSMSAARMALSDGTLPYVRITSRRFLIPEKLSLNICELTFTKMLFRMGTQ